MKNMLAITTLATVISLNTAASAEERVEIEDTFPITATCKAWLEEIGVSSYEFIDWGISPDLIIRPPAYDVTFRNIWFAPFSHGILIEHRGMQIIQCNEPMTMPYFALAEKAERFRVTDTFGVKETINTVEIHFHSKVKCGNPCRYAQIDTVVFPDEQKPYGFMEMESLEYPSKWYRGYLTEEERAIFDRIIEEG